jgi:hypothetical protein
MGKVIFESGSIEIPDPKSIKLLNQHDIKKPLGRGVSFSESENSIDAVFSISRSQRGNRGSHPCRRRIAERFVNWGRKSSSQRSRMA